MLGLDLRRFWDRESFRRSVLLSIPSPPPPPAAPPLVAVAVVVRALALDVTWVAAASTAGGAPAVVAVAVAAAMATATASPPGGPGDPRPAVGDACGLTAPSMLRGLSGLPSGPRSSL